MVVGEVLSRTHVTHHYRERESQRVTASRRADRICSPPRAHAATSHCFPALPATVPRHFYMRSPCLLSVLGSPSSGHTVTKKQRKTGSSRRECPPDQEERTGIFQGSSRERMKVNIERERGFRMRIRSREILLPPVTTFPRESQPEPCLLLHLATLPQTGMASAWS